MANILITGGTGSLGSALVKRWYGQHNLTILSKDVHRQSSAAQKFPKARYILADIENREQVHYACKGQDILIHAAALKVVQAARNNLTEFQRVNVDGTVNVARCWAATHHYPHPITGNLPTQPRQALFISTDKAVSPLNFYGATKLIAERIWGYQFGYSVLRYGNVVESAGSFIHKWRAQGTITVTQPTPTRFFLLMEDAVNLIEEVLAQQSPGVFVPNSLRAFSVHDVAVSTDKPIKYTPMSDHEKQHEVLIAPGEGVEQVSNLLSRVFVPHHTDNELYYLPYRSNTAPRMSGQEVLESIW